jgi:hypothetical protein
MNDVSPQQLNDRIELAALVANLGTDGLSLQIGSVMTGLHNGIGQRMRTITVSLERPSGDARQDAAARALWIEMAHTTSIAYQVFIPAGLWQRVLRDTADSELRAARDAHRALLAAEHLAPCIPVAVPVETAQPHQQ